MKRALRFLVFFLCFALLFGCAEENTITILTPDSSEYYNTAPTDAPVDQPRQVTGEDGSDPYGGFIAPAPGVYEGPAEQADTAPAQQDNSQSSQQSLRSIDLIFGVVVGDNAVLSPLRTPYVDFNSVNALVFEGLVELDENLQPQPMLADRWTKLGDEWTFTLRTGVEFHNGAPLTADDVVASFYDALNYTDTVWYPLIRNIDSMRAIDEITVQVKAASGLGYMMLYAMTFPVVQQSSLESQTPFGTGPFWYMGYETSQYVWLESNPLWWRRPNDDIHTIYAVCYDTSQDAMTALERGEIDAMATRSSVAALSKTLSDRLAIDYSTTRYECIVPNLRDTILKSAKVRQALMYAIDRTSLANSAYTGMVQESEVPVVPGSWLYNTQATRYNYSPERALQLLMEDGWSDSNGDGILEKEIDGLLSDLTLTLMTYNESNTPIRSEAAQTIADQLLKVGIRVNVMVGDRSKVSGSLKDHDFQLALVSYNLSQMPNLAFLFTPSGSGNYSGYVSEEMETYLRTAYQATEESELIAAMAQVQMKIVDDLPILGLFFRTGVLVSKKRVGGLTGIREGHVLRGLERATFE